MDDWKEFMLKRLGTPYSNEKPGFIMGVSGGGKKYSSREYESIVKNENKKNKPPAQD